MLNVIVGVRLISLFLSSVIYKISGKMSEVVSSNPGRGKN